MQLPLASSLESTPSDHHSSREWMLNYQQEHVVNCRRSPSFATNNKKKKTALSSGSSSWNKNESFSDITLAPLSLFSEETSFGKKVPEILKDFLKENKEPYNQHQEPETEPPSFDQILKCLSASFDPILEADLSSPAPANKKTEEQQQSLDVVSAIVRLAEKNKAEAKHKKAQRSRIKKVYKKRSEQLNPWVKEYTEPSDKDVLFGRGGLTNHHPGNVTYRGKVGELCQSYQKLMAKTAKTELAGEIVDWVQQEQHGRFLKQDPKNNKKWYVVMDGEARRKACTALREYKPGNQRDRKK
mmetsp:Transcript_2328/g.3380  ORF Transcript_2328/g.3380 Transcript_2328/m.3380 type:complete len:299 (+) Transcript_2328:27-923(+)